jgi:hypothetical protein
VPLGQARASGAQGEGGREGGREEGTGQSVDRMYRIVKDIRVLQRESVDLMIECVGY